MAKIAACIIANNESAHIVRAIKEVKNYVDAIFVVDDNSNDDTAELADKAGADVITISKGRPVDCRNIVDEMASEYDWHLHIDPDEIFDPLFYIDLPEFLKRDHLCYRLPRINLPTAQDYPDYQVRLFKHSSLVKWINYPHNVLYSIEKEIPVDQIDCITLNDYHIVHLKRRTDLRRAWW